MCFWSEIRRSGDRRHTVEGPSKGHRVMALRINVLCVWYAALYIGLVFSGFVVAAKKVRGTHEEGIKKAQ